jgi:hypothetical protein
MLRHADAQNLAVLFNDDMNIQLGLHGSPVKRHDLSLQRFSLSSGAEAQPISKQSKRMERLLGI